MANALAATAKAPQKEAIEVFRPRCRRRHDLRSFSAAFQIFLLCKSYA